jgi:hypothetical protein
MKVTVSFSDDSLYVAMKVRAAQSGRQVRDLIEEAIDMWLTAQEDAEDIANSEIALAEAGWIDAEEYFEKMVAEERVTYGA